MTRLPLALWIIGALALACGSKKLSPAAANIRDGSELELTDCTVIQRVSGTASQGDPAAEEHAKNNAREKAAALGATHIRWIVPCCTSVEGDAYRCDLPD